MRPTKSNYHKETRTGLSIAVGTEERVLYVYVQGIMWHSYQNLIMHELAHSVSQQAFIYRFLNKKMFTNVFMLSWQWSVTDELRVGIYFSVVYGTISFCLG